MYRIKWIFLLLIAEGICQMLPAQMLEWKPIPFAPVSELMPLTFRADFIQNQSIRQISFVSAEQPKIRRIFRFDVEGNLTQMAGVVETDTTYEERYVYTEEGDLMRKIIHEFPEKKTISMSYRYDVQKRLFQQKTQIGTLVETYYLYYNANEDEITQIKQNGTIQKAIYQQKKLMQEQDANGNISVTYRYNSAGALVASPEKSSSCAYEGQKPVEFRNAAQVFRYTYAPNGVLKQIIETNGDGRSVWEATYLFFE